MRHPLIKGHSTKAERRFMELLKEQHVPYRAKVMIEGREVDFLIGKYAVDIDGHEQDGEKNHMLVEAGYVPIHLTNQETHNKQLCLTLISQMV